MAYLTQMKMFIAMDKLWPCIVVKDSTWLVMKCWFALTKMAGLGVYRHVLNKTKVGICFDSKSSTTSLRLDAQVNNNKKRRRGREKKHFLLYVFALLISVNKKRAWIQIKSKIYIYIEIGKGAAWKYLYKNS